MSFDKTNSTPIKRSFLQRLGPGIITAALVFGPGSLTLNTKLGAGFGYSLFWVIMVAMVFMEAYTRMSTKIGLYGGQSIISRIKQELNTPLSYLVGIGVFLTTSSFQAGNTIGASVAFAELFQSSVIFWISFFSFGAASLLFFKSFYKILEKLMISLVIIMLGSFFVTIIMASPNISDIVSGMVPSIPTGSEFLIISLTASSFSIVGAFYQSYLVREKGLGKEYEKDLIKDSFYGIVILGVLSTLVMFCAAAVLKNNNIEVQNASDLGMALEPLFGSFTSKAFMIGLFAASFSSMIGNATIGGVILSDTIFSDSKLSSKSVRMMIVFVIMLGAIIAAIFGRLPLELIIFSQGITVLLVPITAIIMLLFSNSKHVAKDRRNGPYLNVIGICGILVLFIMSIYTLKYLLF